jgi:hypothetical protein
LEIATAPDNFDDAQKRRDRRRFAGARGIGEMTEFIGWVIVLGLAVAIGSIFALSRQIERYMRDTIESMKYSNQLILARLERLADPSIQPEPTVGLILERRRAQRRSLLNPISENPYKAEQRGSPGRRFEDFPATGQAGYLPF